MTAKRRDQRLWKEVEGPSGSLDRALRKLGAISMRAYAMTAQYVKIFAVLQTAGVNRVHVDKEYDGILRPSRSVT